MTRTSARGGGPRRHVPPLPRAIKGYRINEDDTVTVPTTGTSTRNDAATRAPPRSPCPGSLAAMDDLVFGAAPRRVLRHGRVPPERPRLSLVMTRDASCGPHPARAGPQKIVPAGYFQVGAARWSRRIGGRRYQAAQDWFDAHGHLVISSGPTSSAATRRRSTPADRVPRPHYPSPPRTSSQASRLRSRSRAGGAPGRGGGRVIPVDVVGPLRPCAGCSSTRPRVRW
jgi:hypothetical protein